MRAAMSCRRRLIFSTRPRASACGDAARLGRGRCVDARGLGPGRLCGLATFSCLRVPGGLCRPARRRQVRRICGFDRPRRFRSRWTGRRRSRSPSRRTSGVTYVPATSFVIRIRLGGLGQRRSRRRCGRPARAAELAQAAALRGAAGLARGEGACADRCGRCHPAARGRPRTPLAPVRQVQLRLGSFACARRSTAQAPAPAQALRDAPRPLAPTRSCSGRSRR